MVEAGTEDICAEHVNHVVQVMEAEGLIVEKDIHEKKRIIWMLAAGLGMPCDRLRQEKIKKHMSRQMQILNRAIMTMR